MADFGYNLLSSVQKKIFPHGIATDIAARLDSMTVFNEEVPENLDSFDVRSRATYSAALSAFNANTDVDSLRESCSRMGMAVKIDSVETKYVADEEETGSLSVYKFTDKRGNEVSITNININESLDKEKVAFDDLIVNLITEIQSGSIALPDSPFESAQAA